MVKGKGFRYFSGSKAYNVNDKAGRLILILITPDIILDLKQSENLLSGNGSAAEVWFQAAFFERRVHMSLMELYYEHYRENSQKNYWELEEKIIPYGVEFETIEAQQEYIDKLEREGFRSVGTLAGYHLFVNIRTKRFGSPMYACHYTLVDDKLFSPEEFEKILRKEDRKGKNHVII